MTAKTATPIVDALACDERHNTVAESRYWCAQYLLLARKLESDRARLIEALKVTVDALDDARGLRFDHARAISESTHTVLRELEGK